MNAGSSADLSAGLRQGWCPGALRPMAAKDGLLVRLRITGGIVPVALAHALADLARRHGNGLFDLSARGNLQMRGVGETELGALQDGLRDLALLDDDARGEAVRNVVASPLAGLHAGLDIRPLIAALEARLASDTALHALPTKFGFIADDGGAPSLASVAADVRFDWLPADAVFSIGLGGTRGSAVRVGHCRPSELVESAVRVATGALRLFAAAPAIRRMHGLIAAFGTAAVADACGDGLAAALGNDDDAGPGALVGLRRHAGLVTLGVAAPFGRLDCRMLQALATTADLAGAPEIRLTPWRILLVPGCALPADMAPLTGFITDAADPRLDVVACVGQDGCARGTTATHADAAALAVTVAEARSIAQTLHVSGCQKGCAKPSASPFTLVGRDGRYDLVRDGDAGATPLRRGLDLTAARAAIAALLEPS